MNHLLHQNWIIFVLLKHSVEAVAMVQCSWQVLLSNNNWLSTLTTCYVGAEDALQQTAGHSSFIVVIRNLFFLDNSNTDNRDKFCLEQYKTAWLILYRVIKLHGTKSIFIFWLISNLNTSFVCKFYMFGILFSFSELCRSASQLVETKEKLLL